MSTSTYRILTDAADLIERSGWTQHAYESHGCYCLYGAIHTAAKLDRYAIDESKSDPLNEAWAILSERVDDNPIAWNDRNGRTKEEVLDLLRTTAAVVAEAKGD
jgi:hypothetical protein